MDDLEIQSGLTIPAAELRVSFARSGGPGGQHVNKVETKVELRWNPGESRVLDEPSRERVIRKLGSKLTSDGDLLVTSAATRDQARNREDARRKLAETVRKALRRPKKRKRTRPSKAAIEKRLQEKRRRAEKKQQRGAPDAVK